MTHTTGRHTILELRIDDRQSLLDGLPSGVRNEGASRPVEMRDECRGGQSAPSRRAPQPILWTFRGVVGS